MTTGSTYWEAHGAFSTGEFRKEMDRHRGHSRDSPALAASWIERALPGPAAANPLIKTKDFYHHYFMTFSSTQPVRSCRVRVYEDPLWQRQPAMILEFDEAHDPHPMGNIVIEYVAGELGQTLFPYRMPRSYLGEGVRRVLGPGSKGVWPPFFLIQRTVNPGLPLRNSHEEFSFVAFDSYVPRGRPGMGDVDAAQSNLITNKPSCGRISIGEPRWLHVYERPAIEDFLGAAFDETAHSKQDGSRLQAAESSP